MFSFANHIFRTQDMTKDNTKFVIIQQEAKNNSFDQSFPKIPVIYDWLDTNTPSKYLYDLVDCSLYPDGFDEHTNKINYQLVHSKNNKIIENNEKEILIKSEKE